MRGLAACRHRGLAFRRRASHLTTQYGPAFIHVVLAGLGSLGSPAAPLSYLGRAGAGELAGAHPSAKFWAIVSCWRAKLEHLFDPPGRPRPVIREELTRLFTWQERHRRLAARLIIAFVLTLVVLAAGSVLIWIFESGKKGGDIHGFGDAVFFTAVQLLTISSSITNPVTAAGKVVDVALEMWAIFVVTAIAGSFASFFGSGDAS